LDCQPVSICQQSIDDLEEVLSKQTDRTIESINNGSQSVTTALSQLAAELITALEAGFGSIDLALTALGLDLDVALTALAADIDAALTALGSVLTVEIQEVMSIIITQIINQTTTFVGSIMEQTTSLNDMFNNQTATLVEAIEGGPTNITVNSVNIDTLEYYICYNIKYPIAYSTDPLSTIDYEFITFLPGNDSTLTEVTTRLVEFELGYVKMRMQGPTTDQVMIPSSLVKVPSKICKGIEDLTFKYGGKTYTIYLRCPLLSLRPSYN
jgi:hypothetical protein